MTLNKERFTVNTCWTEEGFTVNIDGKEEVVLNTDWLVGEPMMLAEINGKDVTVQVRNEACCHNMRDFSVPVDHYAGKNMPDLLKHCILKSHYV